MKRRFSFGTDWPRVHSLALLVFAVAWCASGDEVQTQNGDRYTGKVISLDAGTLVLQSDVLGTVRMPRSKVTLIALGTNITATLSSRGNPGPGPAAKAAPAPAQNFSAEFSQLGTNSALIQQVQRQFLAGAGPEANRKFSDLLNGLASGRITSDDLRAQAKAAADQMRAVQKELGGDADGALDGYISILDDFVKEADSPGPGSNATRSP